MTVHYAPKYDDSDMKKQFRIFYREARRDFA